MANERTGAGRKLVNINLQVNPEDFRDEINAAAQQFTKVFEKALGQVTASFKETFEDIASVMQSEMRGAANDAGRSGARAGDNFGEEFTNSLNLTESLRSQIDALQRSARSRGDLAENLGLGRDIFAGAEGQIQDLTRQLRAFEEAQEGSLSPEAARAYATTLETGLGTVRGELRATEGVLRSFSDEVNRQRTANTATFQQETTLQNAQIRSQAQLQIQQSQRAGRARIEIARFTFRQIQFFEQQLARAIRGSFSALGGLVSGAASGVTRLAGVFRRSNRDINDGFRGALNQRERTLSRSFRRQTTDVNREVARQSATLQRFERRASTGLAGIASGRSQLGLLLGGGAAVGLGFQVAQGLRSGFNEAVDLNEAMNAVVQIFGEATDEVVAFTENSVDALFLTQSEALKAAQNFGVFGKSAGLAGSDLSGFSNELTTIAADLASFYNTTVPEAATSLSAALRGESEPIRRYGVLLNEQILRQRALQDGIIDSDRQLVPSERVLAAYAEILKQTAVAQGDAARTADDFANSSRRARAAVITTFASVAQAAIPLAETLLQGVLPALDAVNSFIEGDVGPVLLTLRTGLLGAAAALTALAAARGGVEVLQFLAIALRSLISPIGLVITAVAGLGAAIAILRDSSPEAAAAFSLIRETITSGLLTGLENAARLLLTVADFVRTRIIPVFVGLVALLVSQVGPAFRFVADIVETRVLPVFRTVGGAIVTGLSAALPVLAAVVGQLVRLGQAIGSVFTGDFSGIANIGRDIGAAFAGLGDLIVNSLVPQLQRGVAFIIDFFAGIDWATIGLGALELLNTIGRILGTIATHPTFITALAAVAGAAALVVGSFVAGVAEGLARNIPGLIQLLNDALGLALTEGLKAAIANPLIVSGLLTGLLAGGLILNSMVKAFNQIGVAGGGSFMKGIGVGVSRGIREFGSATRALFAGGEATFARAGTRQGEAYNRALQAKLNEVRLLTGQEFTPFGKNAEAKIRSVDRRLKEVNATLTDGQRRALLFRGEMSRAFSTRSITAFTRGLQAVNWSRLGATAGAGFMFGYTSFISGQQGGTAGIVGVTTSALAAGLSTGSPWVAAGVAAAGLVAFAFRDVEEAADKAREAVGSFADALVDLESNGEKVEVIFDGIQTSFDETFDDAVEARLLNLLPAGALQRASQDIIAGNLDIDDSFQDLLRTLELTDAQFNTLASLGPTAALTGDIDFDALPVSEIRASRDAVQALNVALGEQRLSADDVNAGFVILEETARSYSDSVDALAARERQRIDLTNQGTRLLELNEQIGATQQLTQAQQDLIDAEKTQAASGFLQRELAALREFAGDLSPARVFEVIIEKAKQAGDAIDLGVLLSLIGLEKASIDARVAQEEQGNRLLELNKNWADYTTNVNAATEGTIEWGEAVDATDLAASQLKQETGLLSAAIDNLNERRTNALNAQIDNLNARLEGAKTAADAAREALTAFITGDYQDTTQALVDDLIGGLNGIGESIVEARQLGGVRGAAAARSIFGDLDSDIAKIVGAGIEEGLSGAEIEGLFGPLNAAIGEVTNPLQPFFDPNNVVIPAEVTDRIFDQIQRRVDPKQIDVNTGAVFGAEAEVQRIQDQLDAYRADLDIDVIFSQEQVDEELAKVGLNQLQIRIVAGDGQTDAAQGSTFDQALRSFLESFAEVDRLRKEENEQAPAGQTRDVQQVFYLPTDDAEEIADISVAKITEAQVSASGGPAPSRNVIYRGPGVPQPV